MFSPSFLLLSLFLVIVHGGLPLPPSPPPPPPPPPGDSYTTSFGWTGNPAICTQCGDPGEYACSNRANWHDGNFTFTDETPVGSMVTKMVVTLLGSYGCDGADLNDLGAYVNGYAINILSAQESPVRCECNSCDGSITLATEAQNGFPGMNLGGENNFSVTSFYDVSCLNSAQLTVYYSPNVNGFSGVTVNATFYTGGTTSTRTPGQCGERTVRTMLVGTTMRFSFRDPLPSQSGLVTAEFEFFGRYFGDGTCSDHASMSVYMGRISPMNQTIYPQMLSPPQDPDYCTTKGCDGSWLFSQSTLYQNGWPGYVYGGGTNYIYVTNICEGCPSGSRIDIASVRVRLYYLTLGG